MVGITENEKMIARVLVFFCLCWSVRRRVKEGEWGGSKVEGNAPCPMRTWGKASRIEQ